MPKAVILGCAGLELTPEEKTFFSAEDPFGFILFGRNCENPEQVGSLVRDLRGTVARADAPVLIDQEGGRVQRLKPPHWRQAPPAARFGELYSRDPAAGLEAVRLNSTLIGLELADLGINVDCLPCLDVVSADGHAIIGDRAFGSDPRLVSALGKAACDGILAAGVLPVLKHVPGHGRARVDSHLELPTVEAAGKDLADVDFAPFRVLSDMPLAMTAHVVYTAFDPEAPATLSKRVVGEVIRGQIGFKGILMSDDISMKALSGEIGTRAVQAFGAGCDIVLHCNGDMGEMKAVTAATADLDCSIVERWERAGALAGERRQEHDPAILARRLEALLAPHRWGT